MERIGQRMAIGAAWMVIFKFAERGLGLISTVILARLLIPADFGLIAMAMSIVAMIELLGAFSFDVALIQNPNAERTHYDTAWTFNVIAAGSYAVLLVLLAPVAASFYLEPRLQPVVYALAAASFVQGFENIGVVAFRKQLDFQKDFRFLLGKKVAAFSVTVPLAFILRSYWALVVGILVGRLVGVALSYYVQSYRPRFSLAARNELFHFSKWLMITNFLAYLRERTPDFVIGRIAGSHSLGLFSVAYEIANLPTSELVAPINRAVYPGYAKLAGTLADLRKHFLQVVSMLMLFVLPAGVGIFLTADLFVPLLLGPKWAATIPLIQMLALAGVLVAVQNNNSLIFLALGVPRVISVLVGLSVILLLPLLIWLVMRNSELGAAQAFLIMTVITVWVNYAVLFQRLSMRPLELLRALGRPVAGTAVMAAAVTVVRAALGPAIGNVELMGWLVTVSGTGAAVYALTVGCLWWVAGRPDGPERFVLGRLMPRMLFWRIAK